MIRPAFAALLGAIAIVVAGCGSTASQSLERPPPVQRVADRLLREGARSAIVFVADDGHTYVGTAGRQARFGVKQRFRVGSVTKTFTAALVLQLVDEGKIDLGSALERYVPGIVPAGRRITIRELLDHESGLANYTDYPSWLDRAERSPSVRPRDVLRFAASHPLLTEPGTGWRYSNSNYVALGLVIEAVTGHSFEQELRDRILKPLELRHTELATTRRPAGLEDEGTNPNLPWAAGGIVSTAEDLARFFSALLSGRVVSPTSLSQMKRTVHGRYEYGLGIFAERLPCGRFWAHSGLVLDYGTSVEASEDGRRVAVIEVRHPSVEPPLRLATLLCR